MFVGSYCSIGLCVLINLNVVLCHGAGRKQLSVSSDKFAYPESEEENPDKQNAQNKTPVYLADSCSPGEILYPGDQLDDWVCDCRPAYVYYPAMRQCYPAYTRGPCPPGHYLILPKNNVVPQCEPNPCKKDNFVRFRNHCYELDKEGPCDLGTQISNVVGVNETTLEIICTKDYKVDVLSRLSDYDLQANKTMNGTVTTPLTVLNDQDPIINGTIYTEKTCFAGGKRWISVRNPRLNFQDSIKIYFGFCTKTSIINIDDSDSNGESRVDKHIQDIFTTNPDPNPNRARSSG